MKALMCFLLGLSLTQLVAQNQLNDTVKIKVVEIKPAPRTEYNQETLDSVELTNPQHINLGDLLAKKSHLFIKSYGIGSMATISLRGSGSEHTQINWNGISLNSSMNGTSDLALFPLFFMDHIDVDYGLASLSEGAGGLGGAVNISSSPDFSNKLAGFVGYTIGSFGQEQWNAQLKYGNAKLQFATKALLNSADNNFQYQDLTHEGFPTRNVQNANFFQHGIMQNVHYKIKENQWMEANVWWFDSKRNLPPLITLRDNIEFQEDQTIKTIVSYSNYLTKGKLKATFAYLYDDLLYENQRAGISSTSETRSLKSRIDYDFNWKNIDLKSQLKTDLNTAYANSLNGDIEQKSTEVFISAFKKLSQGISIQFSARELIVFDEASYFLPQTELVYTSTSGKWYGHGKVGRNVKFPSLNDFYFEPSGNTELRAENATSSELSLARIISINEEKLMGRVSSTVFYNNIENYIQWQPTAFGFWQPINLKSVETFGAELFLELAQKQGVIKKQLTGTYSYTKSRNWEKKYEFDESVGKQLIYIPEHKGNVALELEYKEFHLSSNFQIIGIKYISSDNTELLPMYSLLDAGLNRTLKVKKHTLECSVGVKNILDSEYQAIEWRPMPNRNYFAKLTYHFKR